MTNKAEIFVLRGSNCSAVFGCESGDAYGLPKQITATINGKEYILQTVDQNTYGLTPEFKQAISQTSAPPAFKIDKKINFEVKEEALPALKQLFTIQPTQNVYN
jgi:hypothetical protein